MILAFQVNSFVLFGMDVPVAKTRRLCRRPTVALFPWAGKP